MIYNEHMIHRSRNFDQYMYENDDFLILVAAGNSGAGDAMNTVGSPATAKNVIAVGSHHSFGSSVPTAKLGPAYVSDFSSRGPTSDGRMKPVSYSPIMYLSVLVAHVTILLNHFQLSFLPSQN